MLAWSLYQSWQSLPKASRTWQMLLNKSDSKTVQEGVCIRCTCLTLQHVLLWNMTFFTPLPFSAIWEPCDRECWSMTLTSWMLVVGDSWEMDWRHPQKWPIMRLRRALLYTLPSSGVWNGWIQSTGGVSKSSFILYLLHMQTYNIEHLPLWETHCEVK